MNIERLIRRAAVSTAFVGGAPIAFGGCNSLLENRPGHLVEEVESGTRANEAGRDGGAIAPAPEGAPAAPAPVSSDDAEAPEAPPAPPPCVVGEKPCDGACVSTDDVDFGCGGPTCERCAPDHATAACTSGGCAIGTCEAGWADCNGLPSDGCETSLALVTSCGACDVACPAAGPHAEVACTDLACVTTCEAGRGDCNLDPADGCEADLMEEKLNCGVCGEVCILGRCRDGTCRFLN